VPGGSGNGFAKSVLFEAGEAFSALNAAYLVIKGQPRPFDLSAVRSASGQVQFSFLSLSWGESYTLVFDVCLFCYTPHNTTQHNTTQHNTTQHTTPHNTTPHHTTPHHITQHNTPPPPLGLIADIDLRTEQLRCLGEARFTTGAAYFIAKKRYGGASSTSCCSRDMNVDVDGAWCCCFTTGAAYFIAKKRYGGASWCCFCEC
jgi:hypothetical protein